MKIVSFAGMASILALAGCASTGGSEPFNALDRQPVNSAMAVAAFEASHVQPVQSTDTRMERQVNDLRRQVGELKAYLVMLQMAQEQGKGPLQTASPADAGAPSASVSFRIDHEAGHSRFTLSSDARGALLVAARASGRITIHGRSDGTVTSKSAKALAIDRAVRVKAFLVSQGIPANRIRVMYCTRGCESGPHQTRIDFSGHQTSQDSLGGIGGLTHE
ncbi:OmpA family protein [Asticcacaulis sp. EMRT-3]|uniref:OmpA family protein n=1 Tax=Asticcacaulis sp. EMRT-3 TaxID=3040349 RepID=UPI0024AF0DD1|nr:OmpA family protein [Asticcacaulis sp. EMRT-3]MDI7776567.1 OmpA family protein [Asticcacaulis sp. EMRT-3]